MMMQTFSKVKINAIHAEERSWRILSDCGFTSVHSKKYMKFHSHELWVKKCYHDDHE